MADDRIVVTSLGFPDSRGRGRNADRGGLSGGSCPEPARARNSTKRRKGLSSGSRSKGRTTRVRQAGPVSVQAGPDRATRRRTVGRLERDYDKVKITAQPMRFFGDSRSDIEKPDVAADEVRVRLMRHFPEGPGMAAIALQAANRYNKALEKSLERNSPRKPKMSELARRWGMFQCRRDLRQGRRADAALHRHGGGNGHAGEADAALRSAFSTARTRRAIRPEPT